MTRVEIGHIRIGSAGNTRMRRADQDGYLASARSIQRLVLIAPREVLPEAFRACHFVDAGRGELLQPEEARPQNIDGEMMQERRCAVCS